MPRAFLLQPTKVGECEYIWDGLETKSTVTAGLGVFATKPLLAGAMIPIIGKKMSESEVEKRKQKHELVHAWIKNTLTGPVNGDPSISPYKNVGNYGLSIAMMLNEPSRKKPNCIFKLDHVVVAQRVKAGEELTIFYGDDYKPVRIMKGYALDKNRFYHNAPYYNMLEDMKFPSLKDRQKNFDNWMQIVAKCDKHVELTRRYCNREFGPIQY